MTCDQTQPLLNTFADRELGLATAWRVRRHLAACPACAAELAVIRRLDGRVRAWRDVPAPAHLQSQIAAVLPPAPPASAPRRPVTARRVAVGLAGVAAASAAFFWLTPGQPGRPTIAFADVEQAMQQVKTVSWQLTLQPEKSPDGQQSFAPSAGPIKKTNKVTLWLRRDPPALADIINAKSSPSLLSGKILRDKRGMFLLSSGACYVIPSPQSSIKETVEDTIRSFTEFPQDAPTSTATLGGKIVRSTRTNFHQNRVVFNGMDQFLFEWDDRRDFPKRNDGSAVYRLSHISTWVDPLTRRVTRTEIRPFKDQYTGENTPLVITTLDHFQYDQTPPKGTFDWSPPPGVRVVRMTAQAVKNSQETVKR